VAGIRLSGQARLAVLVGALLVMATAVAGARVTGPGLIGRLQAGADAAIAKAGGAPVRVAFTSPTGMVSRHPILSGGEGLSDGVRAEIARAVAGVPGVGGVRWADGAALSRGMDVAPQPVECEADVATLLRAQTIRFEEGSARIDATSRSLVDEVADALRPCLGSIIAITGHTDASGSEPSNLVLSFERAEAVVVELIARGIPADGLRVRGLGSRQPLAGLEATDPANRRIEFSVVATDAPQPTPVDTPAPR